MRGYSHVPHTKNFISRNSNSVRAGTSSGRTGYGILSEYCDSTIPIDTPVRHEWCPFCNKDVKARGFIVWRNAGGWSFYCHKCGTSKRVKSNGVASPSALISRVNGLLRPLKPKAGTIYLPEDFELTLPFAAKQWLRKYGVTDDECRRYRFGYSERMNRLIMPVFKDGEVIYWQARRLSGNKHEQKYLTMRGAQKEVLFELVNPNAKEVVLVEDIVSAIVLRRSGYNAVALLGSFIGDTVANILVRIGVARVGIWLDPDKRREAVKFAKKLSGLGFSATALVTPTKDPKDYSITQVRAHLKKGGFDYDENISTSRASQAGSYEGG